MSIGAYQPSFVVSVGYYRRKDYNRKIYYTITKEKE